MAHAPDSAWPPAVLQGTPPVQMVTPRSLLYEGYSMQSPAQRQRLQGSQPVPQSVGAAMFPGAIGGPWAPQGQPSSNGLQMHMVGMQDMSERFFPHLSRR